MEHIAERRQVQAMFVLKFEDIVGLCMSPRGQ